MVNNNGSEFKLPVATGGTLEEIKKKRKKEFQALMMEMVVADRK